MSVHRSRGHAILRMRYYEINTTGRADSAIVANGWNPALCAVERKQIAQILQTILTKPPFDIFASDIMVPLTNSPDGHKYSFNFIDLYTSWPEVTLKS